MDPTRFDALTRSVMTSSRRGALRLLAGSVLTGLLPLGTRSATAKTRGTRANHRQHSVADEACIPTGRACPSPKPRGRKGKGKNGKGPKQLSCNDCCQGHSTTGPNGKYVCTCQPDGLACGETGECCSGRCAGGTC